MGVAAAPDSAVVMITRTLGASYTYLLFSLYVRSWCRRGGATVRSSMGLRSFDLGGRDLSGLENGLPPAPLALHC
jgi:hypothetical protein